jgi:precorrin-2 dehydrogenase/sirohydrochlorin ferrochelatase
MSSKSDRKRVYYPAFLDITDKRCLVVGSGKVAERKVAMLLQFNAHVIVVGPVMTKALLKLGEEGKIAYFQRRYTAKDLDNTGLVFACTDDNAINNKIKKEAARKNIPVNVADSPDLCDFIVPSIIRKGGLTIAISTSGELPLLSKKLRQKIEEVVTDDYLEYLHIIGEFRRHLLKTVKEARKRGAIMKNIEKMDIQEVIAAGLEKIKKSAQLL